MPISHLATGLSLGALFVFASQAQSTAELARATQLAVPPPPATKLEAFKPAAGSVVTLGYDELGAVGSIAVDVRAMHDSKGGAARGLLVEIAESEYRRERSNVDVDEIPELLKGIDALLEVKGNPTQFKSFEVRYVTRGELQLTAFNTSRGDVLYSVRVGRVTKAQRVGLPATDMQKLRALFEAASQKLKAVTPQ